MRGRCGESRAAPPRCPSPTGPRHGPASRNPPRGGAGRPRRTRGARAARRAARAARPLRADRRWPPRRRPAARRSFRRKPLRTRPLRAWPRRHLDTLHGDAGAIRRRGERRAVQHHRLACLEREGRAPPGLHCRHRLGADRRHVKARILLRLERLHHHGAFRQRAAARDAGIGTLERLDGQDHAALDHDRLADVERAERARHGEADLGIGALLAGETPPPQWSPGREQVRHERQRRGDAHALALQRVGDGAQGRVVPEAAQPGEDLHAQPVGAEVEEPHLAQPAAEHRLAAAALDQDLGDVSELTQLDPGEPADVPLQLGVGLALVRRGHHGAPGGCSRLGEEDRKPARAGDQPDRLHQRAMPRCEPSRKATKWSISPWPPYSALTCATASRSPILLRKTILYAPFTRAIACSSKWARVSPTVLSPTTSARSPCTVTYGGTSCVTIAPPETNASRPMRVNWCTADSPPKITWSSTA